MCFSIINSIWFYLMLENNGESERVREWGGGCKENGDIIRLVHETLSSNIVCAAICPLHHAPPCTEKSHYSTVML
jgi:hypothetical protein